MSRTLFPHTSAPDATVDAYLAELRTRLRALPAGQVTDIVEEIRSHIRDTAGARGAMTEEGVNVALERLGPAPVLAASYITDDLLTRAQRNRMPWTILRGMFHWAMLSVKGFFALLVCIVGYLFGASFFIAALAKPFNPQAGLWFIPPDSYSLVLGIAKYAPQGRELLGWKLIPIGFAVGGGTIMLTTYFAQWFIVRFRQTRQLRATAP